MTPDMDLSGLGPQTVTFDRVTAEWIDGRWHIKLWSGPSEVWQIVTPRESDRNLYPLGGRRIREP